jgi:hypothetical protein
VGFNTPFQPENIGASLYNFGFYKIQGSIKDGDGNVMKFSRYILMPPWKEILIIILIIGAWIWFLKKFRISAKGGSQPKAEKK